MLTQEQCDAILGPHEALVVECVEAGVTIYFEKYPEDVQIEHTPRTRSSARHDHIIAGLRREFHGSTYGRIVEHNNLTVLALNGELEDGTIGTLALRFNKWDDGKPHTNDTAQTWLFNGQRPLQAPEGTVQIPDHATYLWVGYELDALGVAAKAVSVSCRLDNEVLWERYMSGAQATPLISLAERRSQEQEERKSGQVRGRKPDVAEDGDDGADD